MLFRSVFALYFFRQKRIVSEKNHALVRMINGTLPDSVDEMDILEESDEETNDDNSVA